MQKPDNTNSTRSSQANKDKVGKKAEKPTQSQKIKNLESEKKRLVERIDGLQKASAANLNSDGTIGHELPENNTALWVGDWALYFGVTPKKMAEIIKEKKITYIGISAYNCYVYRDEMISKMTVEVE